MPDRLDHPRITHFLEIFYGASYNERVLWDNHRAYDSSVIVRPVAAEDFRANTRWPSRRSANASDPRAGAFIRAARALRHAEFDGDAGRIDWKKEVAAFATRFIPEHAGCANHRLCIAHRPWNPAGYF